jgi:hypothetical protein
MGQANAARDKLYDLRECSLTGGVIMSKTDVSKANFKEAQFSKGYLHGKSYILRQLHPHNEIICKFIIGP